MLTQPCDNTQPVTKRRSRNDAEALPITAEWRRQLSRILDDESNDWTRARLARATGTTKTTISRIVDGPTLSSALVGAITDELAEYDLRAPVIQVSRSVAANEIVSRLARLDEDDMAIVLAAVRRLSRD